MLARLKPDPIPKIFPVPEYLATGRLLEVYNATKQGLNVPWMGVVSMSFAHYPNFYDKLWSSLAPIASTAPFVDACAELRAVAEAQALQLRPSPLGEELVKRGYAPEELNDIRACIEIFSAGNMPYVLMATLARLQLEGHDLGAGGPAGPRVGAPPFPDRPPLMQLHHADPSTRAIFDDVMKTLGLPLVNTDYRAFARWPSYFALAWADLKRAVEGPGYADAVLATHDTVVNLARSLPNPAALPPSALIEAAERDAPLAEVLSVVRLFQWLLPGLIVNVGFMQEQVRAA